MPRSERRAKKGDPQGEVLDKGNRTGDTASKNGLMAISLSGNRTIADNANVARPSSVVCRKESTR